MSDADAEANSDTDGLNRFLDLADILAPPRLLTIGAVASAIEKQGIYSWDRYGRLVLFSHETEKGKAALDLLAAIYTYENYADDPAHQCERHPLDGYAEYGSEFFRYGWPEAMAPDFDMQGKAVTFDKPVLARERSTLLTIIGGLLALMLGKTPAGNDQSVFKDQSAIIATLLGHYGRTPGISVRTLEEKFAAGKRSLTAS